MNFAEQLRNANALPEEFKTMLKGKIASQFRNYGYFEIICDDHIGDLKDYAIPSKYRESLINFGKQLGFNIRHSRNTCGVKYIEFH